jgi:ABC-2 type transport system ATP-binding protein
VIATRLREGRTVVHVLADDRPGGSFEPVQATLEDVYFATLSQQRREQAAATA